MNERCASKPHYDSLSPWKVVQDAKWFTMFRMADSSPREM